MTKPLISILIPVYNRGSLLGHTVDSALNQTYNNLEIVIVDNCSTDDTWDVCNSYRAKDSRVRIFRNDSNIGPVKNWQRCVNEAQGVFAKLLFSDDLMAPECIEKLVPYLDSDDVGFVFSSANVGPEPWQGGVRYNPNKLSSYHPSETFLIEALFSLSTPLSPAAALFRLNDLSKNIFVEIPSPTYSDFQLHGAGPDLLIYLLTAVSYKKIAFHAEPLIYFRAHSDSISISTSQNLLQNYYRQARIWFAENYIGGDPLQKLYLLEWKRYCKREKSWSLPSAIISKFTFVDVKINPLEFIKFIFTKSTSYKKNIVISLK